VVKIITKRPKRIINPTMHGYKKNIRISLHEKIVEGSKRPRTTSIRKGKHRNTPHYSTYSEGKSSVNRRTGRK
jgi:hypothetical protein